MRWLAVLFALIPVILPLSAGAETTSMSVYVISRGAKFVGSSVGGARVTIRDAASGEVLAQGVTEGATGDTELIMGERGPGDSPITDDVAAFVASLDLAAPRRVSITAYGPLDYPASANSVSHTEWVLPGTSTRPILELPGLVVHVHDTPTLIERSDGEARLGVQATVRMMCGCPLTPDGLWDSNGFDVLARVSRDGVAFAAAPLAYAGEASEFAGELLLTQPGTYRLTVHAHQASTGNAGLMERVLVVR